MSDFTAQTPARTLDLLGLDDAINTMDRDAQFRYLLPLLPGYLQTELVARWEEAGEVADPERRTVLQGAVLVSMYGVKSS